jgi:hypothetical protein
LGGFWFSDDHTSQINHKIQAPPNEKMGTALSVIESTLSVKDDDLPPSGSPTRCIDIPTLSPPLRRSTRGCAGDQDASPAPTKYHHSNIPGDDSRSVDFTTPRMDEDDLVQIKAASLLKAAAGVLHGLRARDDAAAALESLAVPAAAARTGEFFY